MAPLRLAALAAVLVLGSGCFVFDELDAGMEIMEAHTPVDKKKPQSGDAGAAGGDAAEPPPTYQQAVSSWFEGARTLSKAPGEGEAEDPVVTCRHGGRSFFARQSDCLARGGEAG